MACLFCCSAEKHQNAQYAPVQILNKRIDEKQKSKKKEPSKNDDSFFN